MTLDLRTPRARTSSGGSRRRPTSSSRTSARARSSSGTSRPTRSRPTASSRCASRCSARTARTRRGPASTASASATAACCTSPAIPTVRPVRVGVTISDYLTGVFAAQAAAVARCTRATRAAARRRGHRRRAVRRRSCASSSGRCPRTTGSASSAAARATGSRTRRRSTTTRPRDGKYVCIVAGSDANFARLCKAMDRPDLLDDPRFATARRPRRARRRDQRHRRRLDGDARRARRSRSACVAHDVPVATAYTAADIFADPHFEARGDLVTVDDPVIGPVRQQAPYPRLVGETPLAPDRCTAARRAHRRGAVGRCSALDADEIDALAREGHRLSATRRRSTTGCSSRRRRLDRADRRLLARRARKFHFPLPRHVPVLRRATTCERVDALAGRDAVGAGPRSPPPHPATQGPVPYGFGVVELVHERLRVDHAPRAKPDPAAARVRPTDDPRRRRISARRTPS